MHLLSATHSNHIELIEVSRNLLEASFGESRRLANGRLDIIMTRHSKDSWLRIIGSRIGLFTNSGTRYPLRPTFLVCEGMWETLTLPLLFNRAVKVPGHHTDPEFKL